MGMIKISCLALYLRIFPSKSLPLTLFCFIGFITAMTLAAILSVVFEYLPIESNWVLEEFGTRRCINRVNHQ
jgi:hypothetical protein